MMMQLSCCKCAHGKIYVAVNIDATHRCKYFASSQVILILFSFIFYLYDVTCIWMIHRGNSWTISIPIFGICYTTG